MIDRIVRTVSDVFKCLSGLLIMFTVVLNFVAVIMRYCFSRPIVWCEEVSLIMFVAALAFALIPLTYARRAVKLDFFTDMMSDRGKLICRLAVDVICIIALGTTSYLGLILIKKAKYRTTPLLNVNYRWIYATMVIGMTASAIIYTYHLCMDIRKSREVQR